VVSVCWHATCLYRGMQNETTTRPTHDRTSAETDWIQSLGTTAYVIDLSDEQDARLVTANAPALDWLGVSRASVRNRHFRDLGSQTGADRAIDAFRNCVRSMRAVPYAAFLTSGAGIAMPMAGPAGHRYVVAVELPDPASAAASVGRPRNEIGNDPVLIGLVHGARNLVTSLIGWAELVKLRPAAGKEPAQYIIEAAARVSELLQQITAIIHGEPDTGDPADPNATVSKAAKSIKALMGAHITVTMNLAAETPRVAMTAEHLAQILLQLATHSRDAMPDGGRFSISTKPITGPASTEWVAITAADTGVGMDQAALSRAFRRPSDSGPASKSSEMGLWPVDRLVWEAGGEIEVQSEPGGGTAIEIRLPPSLVAHRRD